MARRSSSMYLWLCLLLTLGGCGGGGGGGGSASVSDSNVAVIEVRQGPLNNINMPYVSVTVCIPGSVPSASTCRTIGNVLLDTGSTGLRLFSSALAGLALPPQTIGSASPVYACAQFVTTLALGTVNLADVSLGGEKAASVPVQVMDSNYSLAGGSSCGQASILAGATNIGANLQGLGGNGILGVGHFIHDGQRYFSCNTFAPGCALSGVATAKQVRNPVSGFVSGNSNGVVVQLPALPANGSVSAQGYLIFGVETQSNNRLGTANIVPMNASGTFFTTTYNQHAYTASIFDSGSNGVFFDDVIPQCASPYADFYCPSSTLRIATTVPGLNAAPMALDALVANATSLFTSSGSSGSFAFNNVAVPVNSPVDGGNLSPYFIWGLPAYFGRSVYTLIEGKTVQPGNQAMTGPLTAFTD